jgi:hypothetical protein
MQFSPQHLDTRRYAKCIEVSKRVQGERIGAALKPILEG